jgi:AcrR family transcriptional regulator
MVARKTIDAETNVSGKRANPRQDGVASTGSGAQRTNAAGLATKLRIIDVAEKLFADRGIDAVTFKDIRVATGLSNNSATQYHFGSKAALVEAILDVRFSEVNKRRYILLSPLLEVGRVGEIRSLLNAFFRPRVEMVDASDCNTYAKFMMEYRIRYLNLEETKHSEAGMRPTTAQIRALLRSAIPELSDELADFRLRTLTNMLDAALVERDTLRRRGQKVPSRETLLQRSLDMASAALAASPTSISD